MILSRPCSLDIVDESSIGYVSSDINARDDNDSFVLERSKSSRRKSRFKNSLPDEVSKWCDRCQYVTENGGGCLHDDSEKGFHGYTMAFSRYSNAEHRQFTANAIKTNARDCGPKFSEKLHCSKNRVCDRFDFHSCGCNQHSDCSAKAGQHISSIRSGRENKTANKTGSFDALGPCYHSGKYGHGYFMTDNFVISKGNMGISGIHSRRGKLHQTKKVWEPTDPQKKCSRSNPDPDSTSRPLSKAEPYNEVENRCEEASVPSIQKKLDNHSSFEVSTNSVKAEAIDSYQCQKGDKSGDAECTVLGLETRSHYYSKDGADEEVDLGPIPSSYSIHNACDSLMCSSSSDNCSSGLSEGDSSTSSSSTHNTESSSVSDSEDASQHSEGREISACTENAPKGCDDGTEDGKPEANKGCSFSIVNSNGFPVDGCRAANFPRDKSLEAGFSHDNELFGYDVAPQQHVLPMHNQHLHLLMLPLTPMGYHNQSPAPWTSVPGNQMVSFTQLHHLMFPRPHGYGLVTNPSSDFCMEFNPLQPVTTSHHLGQYPPFPFANEANIVHSNQMNEQHRIFKVSRAGGSFVPETVGCAHPLDHPLRSRQLSRRTHSAQENGSPDDTTRSRNAPSFSLFQFGGPMAMASGYDLNSTSLEEEINGSVFPNLLEKQTDVNSNKKEVEVEEYSLFSSNNGVRFFLLG